MGRKANLWPTQACSVLLALLCLLAGWTRLTEAGRTGMGISSSPLDGSAHSLQGTSLMSRRHLRANTADFKATARKDSNEQPQPELASAVSPSGIATLPTPPACLMHLPKAGPRSEDDVAAAEAWIEALRSWADELDGWLHAADERRQHVQGLLGPAGGDALLAAEAEEAEAAAAGGWVSEPAAVGTVDDGDEGEGYEDDAAA